MMMMIIILFVKVHSRSPYQLNQIDGKPRRLCPGIEAAWQIQQFNTVQCVEWSIVSTNIQ